MLRKDLIDFDALREELRDVIGFEAKPNRKEGLIRRYKELDDLSGREYAIVNLMERYGNTPYTKREEELFENLSKALSDLRTEFAIKHEEIMILLDIYSERGEA